MFAEGGVSVEVLIAVIVAILGVFVGFAKWVIDRKPNGSDADDSSESTDLVLEERLKSLYDRLKKLEAEFSRWRADGSQRYTEMFGQMKTVEQEIKGVRELITVLRERHG